MSWMLEPIKEGLLILLALVAPTVVVAAGIGLVIGLIQAATQIQDQTIPTALKLVGIAVVLIIFSPFMFGNIRAFTNKIFSESFAVVLENRTEVASEEELINDQFEAKSKNSSIIPKKLNSINRTKYNYEVKKDEQRTTLPPLNSFSAINQALVNQERKKKKKKQSKTRKKFSNPSDLKIRKRPKKRVFPNKRAKAYSSPFKKNSVLLKAQETPINLDQKKKRIRPILPNSENKKQKVSSSQLELPIRKKSPEDWW